MSASLGEAHALDSYLIPHTSYLIPHTARLFLQVLIKPIRNGCVPQLRILRFEHPMPFVGVVEELRRDAAALQGGEELQPLADRDAEIELAVGHQGWSLEVLRVKVRRPILIQLGVVPRIPLEL